MTVTEVSFKLPSAPNLSYANLRVDNEVTYISINDLLKKTTVSDGTIQKPQNFVKEQTHNPGKNLNIYQ